MSLGRLSMLVAWLVGADPCTVLAGPHAVEIVRAQGSFGPAPYNDANALLGAPATRFFDAFGVISGGTTNPRVKLVEPAFNIAVDTNGLITPNLLLTFGAGSEVVAKLDEPVTNHPANPYGVDLLVFGNTFYTANGAANDAADLNTLALTGGAFSEPLKISVSPGPTGLPGELPGDPDTWPWYRFETGPYGDTVFPTQAFEWDRDSASWTDDLMDFTKPVNPAMQPILAAGSLTAADAIELYAGSGGGTGLDIAQSGFEWILYVKVDGLDAGFDVGEIDAFSVVRPRVTGESLSIAPQNITNNTASLCFQWPTAPLVTQVQLDFLSVSDTALASTTSFTNFGSFSPLPGIPMNAVEIALQRIPGTGSVSFAANLSLSAGSAYHGDGSDLLVVQSASSNWTSLAFTYDPSTTTARVNGITNVSVIVVTQLMAPPLEIQFSAGDVSLNFTPVAGNLHTVERSTTLGMWTPIHAFTATNSQPVNIPDPTPPSGQAFYRLALTPP